MKQNLIPKKNLFTLVSCYELVIRSSLDPSSKVIALTLIYQGAFKPEGTDLTNEVISQYTGLNKSTVISKLGLLVKNKVFHRSRHLMSEPYTYYFNRNNSDWKVGEDVI